MSCKNKSAVNSSSNERNKDPNKVLLSKNELRRREKRQMMLIRRAEFKAKAKEKRKIKRKSVAKSDETLSRKKLKNNSMSASLCKIQVAIDCSFDEYMNDKDIIKLERQLGRCYSLNRRASNPLQLYICNINGKIKERLDFVGDYLHWDINRIYDSYGATFEASTVIYLTGDSPNVLSTLDSNHVYVIGGLVDHNHQKGLCLDLAEQAGISHARLPISEFISMTSRHILSVNQVFEILLHFSENGDWKRALLDILPLRKKASEKDTSHNIQDIHSNEKNTAKSTQDNESNRILSIQGRPSDGINTAQSIQERHISGINTAQRIQDRHINEISTAQSVEHIDKVTDV